MVRKRAASDMELQTATGAIDNHQRLLRRQNHQDIVGFGGLSPSSTLAHLNNNVNGDSSSTTPHLVSGVPVGLPPAAGNVNIADLSNYSTMTLPSSSSTNTAHVMSLSTNRSATTCSSNYMDSPSPNKNPPPLCVFSGLPLFPPDRNYHLSNVTATGLLAPPPSSNNNNTTAANQNTGIPYRSP